MNRRKSRINFKLQEMELLYEQEKGNPDRAHRHDYYTLLLVEKAKGNHTIDYTAYPFRALEVHFVSPGQIHQVALPAKPKGHVITFTKDFLVTNNIPASFISNINLFQDFDNTPPLKLDTSTFSKLKGIIAEMQTCLTSDINYRDRALGALLQLLLIHCTNSAAFDKVQINEEKKGICMLRDFKTLVEEKYNHWHKVKDYASEISISPKHLSQTIKNITGKVAKDHIQDRIALEAKRLLLHTTLSVKEVGYRIGFQEPLHFSSFFKNREGVSPSQFRKNH